MMRMTYHIARAVALDAVAQYLKRNSLTRWDAAANKLYWDTMDRIFPEQESL